MNIALIKAGGVGNRMGSGIPKQFVNVMGKPVIMYTLEAFQKHPCIDAIYVVCVDKWKKNLEKYVETYNITKLKGIVAGGSTSLESIKNGIDYIRDKYDEEDIILIHDANRPCLSQDVISGVITECEENNMAVAVMPCDDEIAVVDDIGNTESNTFTNHKKLYRVQTPDAYRLKIIKKIFDNATAEQLETIGATNVLAVKQGYPVHFSNGSALNIRLTTMEDISLMKGILKLNFYD